MLLNKKTCFSRGFCNALYAMFWKMCEHYVNSAKRKKCVSCCHGETYFSALKNDDTADQSLSFLHFHLTQKGLINVGLPSMINCVFVQEE